MKRFLCLSMFVALTLMSNATFAADECTKITATGHRYYPVIAYKDGDNIVGAAPTLGRDHRQATQRASRVRNIWGLGRRPRLQRATVRPT
mgnify:CR=1 FL=1